uniref:Reverse transcriptase zinc-binding domain-containing protein n=1 Tax=Aegilops tauschii subsp. strangulata TaxID=200361 RepID=A0A453ITS5_AEGTS
MPTKITPSESNLVSTALVQGATRHAVAQHTFVPNEIDQQRVETVLQCKIAKFSCRYLGLQLAIHQLSRADWQPLLDQVRHFIPAWQRDFIQRSGRLVLVKTVIVARPVHQLLVLDPPAWVLEDINKWMRSFFWAGKDKSHGEQCLVAWDTVCRLTSFGGLGVKNLAVQALALRVRWEWLRRTDPKRPWQGLHLMVDEQARAVFDSLVKITIGEGSKILFWKDRWIHGVAIKDIAPLLLQLVSTRDKNRRTVQEALLDNAWANDIHGELSFMGHMQVYLLTQAISLVERNIDEPDQFDWPYDASGKYTTSSTYTRLCIGYTRAPAAGGIWRS